MRQRKEGQRPPIQRGSVVPFRLPLRIHDITERRVQLGPRPGEPAWPTVAGLGAIPANSGNGYRSHELAAILKWGTGQVTIEAIEWLSKRYLVETGVTLKEAEQWAYAYAMEASQVPNPSAWARARVMRCVVKLLRSPD